MSEWLNGIDTQLFLYLNGLHSTFFDSFFILVTSLQIWFPLYMLLIFILLKKYRINGLWIILFIVIAIVASDQLSGLIKDAVQRLRPSHEQLLQGKVHNIVGQGGLYGFVSGHATNVFSLAILVGSLSRNRIIFSLFLIWALIVSYSRVYVGVHYPLDIICGGILGSVIGWVTYILLKYFDSKYRRKAISKVGAWNSSDVLLLSVSFLLIFLTLLMSSKVIGVHFIK